MLRTIVRRPDAAADISLGIKLAESHDRPIGPDDVARILRNARVKYVIVGAHAVNGYTGRPRATVDVDVIAQFPKKAARAVMSAYPELHMNESAAAIRFTDERNEAIDILKPTASKLWTHILKHAREIVIGRHKLRVPTLEGMLAAKFQSMISPARRIPDRQQDAVDFMRVVEANEAIDLDGLRVLGELVCSGGGGELLQYVADTRAGKSLRI